MKLTDPRPMSEPPKLNGVYLVKYINRCGNVCHSLRAYSKDRGWMSGQPVNDSTFLSKFHLDRAHLYKAVRYALRQKITAQFAGITWQGLTEDLRP